MHARPHQMQYSKYLGDGDSNSYYLEWEKPYGNDATTQKLECIGNDKKGPGTRLRRLEN